MEVQVSGPQLAEHFHSHQRLRLLYLGSATLYTSLLSHGSRWLLQLQHHVLIPASREGEREGKSRTHPLTAHSEVAQIIYAHIPSVPT